MTVTLDQARALDALARHGTFARAAAALQKRHTAVLYALKTLEEQTALALLDRRGYRTRLTEAGERVLGHARKLLACERELEAACVEIRTGWEPELRVVFDDIFPVAPILGVVDAIARADASTRVDMSTDFLAGVERTFVEADADLMISILPPRSKELRVVRLAPIRARLVAHREHALARAGRDLDPSELAAHVLLTVPGSDARLQLSTGGLEPALTVRLADFHAKKAGILARMGYGWMPEHLVQAELARGTLVTLPAKIANVHVFEPRLYFRAASTPGRAARIVIDRLKEDARSARRDPAARA
ncbi:MAG TPA: LysR family transcriptional regulator [Labilithrix sp.]|nr:LysR family transcriptional regulator [Labilithrix sp.]